MINISFELWLFIMFLLGAGIVVSMRLGGSGRIGNASIIFIVAFAVMFALKYFYSFAGAISFICILMMLLKKFGAINLLWIPLALFIWVPYQPPLPGFVYALFRDINVVELAVLVGFVLWVMHVSILHNEVIPQVPYWHFLGIFFLGGALAFCFGFFLRPIPGFDVENALSFLRRICIVSLFLYILTIQSVRNVKNAEKIMIAFLLGAAIMAIFILRSQRPIEYDPSDLIENTRSEFVGLFALPFGLVLTVGGNTAAAYFAMAALLSFSLWLNGILRWHRLTGFCVFVFSTSMIIVMSTRGIWIAFIPAILIVIFLSIRKRRVPLARYFLNLLLALCIIFVIYSFFQLTDINNRVESLIHHDLLQSDESYMSRVEQYNKLIPIFMENILGVGYMGQYTQTTIHPHSLYLKLALMTGILGLVSYVSFLILITRYFYNKLFLVSQGYWIIIGAIAVIFLILIYGLTGDVIGRFYTNASFILICALAMAVARSSNENLQNSVT